MPARSTATEIAYAVRRSPRARRVRVNVDARARVEVVLPLRASERAAAAAVGELRPWIERRLAEVGRARAVVAARGDTVPYLGTTLQLEPQAGRARASRRGQRLLVPTDEVHAAIERFYRRAARKEIVPRLDRASAHTGVAYRKLSIRCQRTRWASCSPSGHMSFNWRLLLGPERVLDYVVWHEICHLEIADHSRRFWALLERRWPDYRRDREWLRRHGATLVL